MKPFQRCFCISFFGKSVGFDEKTADVRIAQYESGTRTPKDNMVKLLADQLDVSTAALKVPEIDSYVGVMHTLFAMEDLYGLKIDKLSDEICIRLNRDSKDYLTMLNMFTAWEEQAQKFRNSEITKEEYDQWRYRYPQLDPVGQWKKIPQLDLDLNETIEKKTKRAI